VTFEEAMSHKATVVSLIHPHDTEMDLSIAIALYFAARGTGYSYTESYTWQPSAPLVTTPARVLLSGLGADELFGGYARHEIAYKRDGYAGLVEELRLDVSRIGQRNLGRDDRAMSHWSKEVRFPFLDEDVVRFAIGLPVWVKCDFGRAEHETGIEPAKRVLRLLADRKGLPIAAREKKRAVSAAPTTTTLLCSARRKTVVWLNLELTFIKTDPVRLTDCEDGERDGQSQGDGVHCALIGLCHVHERPLNLHYDRHCTGFG